MQQPPRGQPAIRMPLVELVLGLHSRKALHVQASPCQPVVSMSLLALGPAEPTGLILQQQL